MTSIATIEMNEYCFDCLADYLGIKEMIKKKPNFPNDKYCIFVTWFKKNKDKYSLRGCIGTFNPIKLHEGLKKYAIISATEDSRFDQITKNEFVLLKNEVSILTNFEKCNDSYDWKIGKHGIMLEFYDKISNQSRSATFLPEVSLEWNWDKETCVKNLFEKSGYTGEITPELLKESQFQRYETFKSSLTYEEYKKKL